jgi:nucleoside-diphosphate-sugar epimerase
LKSVCYRPFSGYGEDQDLNYPFPSICKRILQNKDKKKFTVWGSGNQMRDFIHIDDCVYGVIKSMNKINNGDPLNLSNGIFLNFKDFAKKTAKIIGYNPKVVGTTNKPEGVFARAGDTSKQKQFGIKYKITLENGIKKSLKFLDNKI